jgi:hypothetical protein
MQISRVATPHDIPPLLQECMKASLLKDVEFSRIYPNKEITGPTIVWRLIRRTLGKENKETKRPRMRGYDTDSHPDRIVVLWGQWSTTIFQFDIFHTSEEEADELMKRFELFVAEARATLRMHGVDTFYLQEQLTDYSVPAPKEIPVRSLRFEATMTTLYPAFQPRIHQIALSVAASTTLASKEIIRTLDTDTDIVDVTPIRIASLGDSAESMDYIACVDYDLVDTGDGSTTIKWREHGLHPRGGNTYYVRYTALVDPLSAIECG